MRQLCDELHPRADLAVGDTHRNIESSVQSRHELLRGYQLPDEGTHAYVRPSLQPHHSMRRGSHLPERGTHFDNQPGVRQLGDELHPRADLAVGDTHRNIESSVQSRHELLRGYQLPDEGTHAYVRPSLQPHHSMRRGSHLPERGTHFDNQPGVRQLGDELYPWADLAVSGTHPNIESSVQSHHTLPPQPHVRN